MRRAARAVVVVLGVLGIYLGVAAVLIVGEEVHSMMCGSR